LFTLFATNTIDGTPNRSNNYAITFAAQIVGRVTWLKVGFTIAIACIKQSK